MVLPLTLICWLVFSECNNPTILKCRFGLSNSWRNEFTRGGGQRRNLKMMGAKVKRILPVLTNFDNRQLRLTRASCRIRQRQRQRQRHLLRYRQHAVYQGCTNCNSSCCDKSHSRAALNSNDIYVSAFVSFSLLFSFFVFFSFVFLSLLYWCSSLSPTNI